MLRKIEIAHMMDAYEEEEFAPEEEALVDPQRVRTAVMGRGRCWPPVWGWWAGPMGSGSFNC